MKPGALLALLFLLSCKPHQVEKNSGEIAVSDAVLSSETAAPGKVEEVISKPSADNPFIDGAVSLTFTLYSNPWMPLNCAVPSNLRCPFIFKTTVDFEAGVVSEQHCECFPEIVSRSLPMDTGDKESYRKIAQGVRLLKKSSTCESDGNPTKFLIKKTEGEQAVYFRRSNVRICEGKVEYVESKAPLSLLGSVSEKLATVAPTSERVLRKIYGDHKGFKLTFYRPYPEDAPDCSIQGSYTYTPENSQVEVATCNKALGLQIRTVTLAAADEQQLLTSLQALEAPTLVAEWRQCTRGPTVLELTTADGSADAYSFNGPSCFSDWTNTDDLRRHIYSPSAQDFLRIINLI